MLAALLLLLAQRFLDALEGDLLDSLGRPQDDPVCTGFHAVFLQALAHEGDGVVPVFAGVPAVVNQEVRDAVLLVSREGGKEDGRFLAVDGHEAS